MGGPRLTPEEVGAAIRTSRPTVIDRFRDDFEFLSNFFLVPVMYGPLGPFPSVENAYQLAKLPKDKLVPEVVLKFQAASPAKAKAFGKALHQKGMVRPDWEQIKVEVMTYLLARKFAAPTLRDQLLETGPRELIEGNLHHDNFWGDCRCTTTRADARRYGQKQGCHMRGQNKLGRLLMDLRAQLAREFPHRCPTCFSVRNLAQLDSVPVRTLGHFEPDGLWVFDNQEPDVDWPSQGPMHEPTRYWCYVCEQAFTVPLLTKEQLRAAIAAS